MGCASPLPMAAADTGTTTIVLVGVTEDPAVLTTVTVAGLLLVIALTRVIAVAVEWLCIVVVWFTTPGVMLTMRGATVGVSGVVSGVVSGMLTVFFVGMVATTVFGMIFSVFNCTVVGLADSFGDFSVTLLLFGPPRWMNWMQSKTIIKRRVYNWLVLDYCFFKTQHN